MGAWNNIPILSAGEAPTDAELLIITAFLTKALEFLPVAFKAADQTVTSSTTLINDNDLFIPMVANANYVVLGKIGYAGNATPQVKYGFTVPSGAAFKYQGNGLDGSITSNGSGIVDKADRTASTPTLGVNGVGSPNAFNPLLNVQMGSTPGNLQFQWAQATSNGTGSLVKNGSWLIAARYA